MANIQPTVDALDQPTVMLQIRKIAGTVDSNLEAVNDKMVDIQNQIDQIEDSSTRIDALEDDMQTAQQAITTIQEKDTEQDTAIQNNENGLVTGASLNVVSGAIQLLLNRALGNINANVTAPFIKTMELIPTATERAFKIRITYWDNTQYDTNDFVIPAGGGTDVSVTGVTIQDGTAPNSFQVQIELSDGTPISSNDYSFPAGNRYPTGISGTVGVDGNIALSIIMNEGNPITTSINMDYFASTADLSDLQKQVTGIKPTVITNLESSPPTISVSVNGSSSTANLPSGGIATGNWEKLALDNFPTDFTASDIIMISLGLTVSSQARDWNTAPTITSVGPAPGQHSNFVIFSLAGGLTRILLWTSAYSFTEPRLIEFLVIKWINNYTEWNSKGNLFTLQPVAVNGGGIISENEKTISFNDLVDYGAIIYRLKQ